MKKFLKKLYMMLTWHRTEAVRLGIVDYSGQGRDEFGR